MDLITRTLYNEIQVRIINIEGEFWFDAKDVCAVLKLTMAKATDCLEDAEWQYYGSDKVISEMGLVALCILCRKPVAIDFYRDITQDVIPALLLTPQELEQKMLSHLRKW
jgi:prophage antirepressor-like protein